MPVDPAPYLSTVILASAALVAIVGGLLVARFVGLDSDQQTSIKLIGDASDRLDIARRRAEAAWESLVRWRAQDFLDDTDVAAALAQGETDAATLRALSRTRLTDDELGIVISQAAADIAKLEEWMAEDAVSAHIRDADYRWHDFQRDDMPQLSYPQLAVSVFETFAEQLYNDNERQRKEEEQRREEERQRAEEEEQRQAAAMGLGGAVRDAPYSRRCHVADAGAPHAAVHRSQIHHIGTIIRVWSQHCANRRESTRRTDCYGSAHQPAGGGP